MLEQRGMEHVHAMMNWDNLTHIFQIPLRWFRDVDRRSHIITDGNVLRAERDNPDGTVLTFDQEAAGIPSSETGTPTDMKDFPVVFDSSGAAASWAAGGANGLVLDCYCKLAPQSSGSNYSVFQRARLTFSKNGLLTEAAVLVDRIRIQAKNA